MRVSLSSLSLSGTIIAGIILTSATAVVTVAQGNPEAAKVKNPVMPSAESVAAGQQIFQRNCAPCHGRTAQGGTGNDLIPAAPNLTDDEWLHGSTDGEIFSVIKNGVPPELNMEPWGDRIKEPDIWNVVNYIRSLGKK